MLEGTFSHGLTAQPKLPAAATSSSGGAADADANAETADWGDFTSSPAAAWDDHVDVAREAGAARKMEEDVAAAAARREELMAELLPPVDSPPSIFCQPPAAVGASRISRVLPAVVVAREHGSVGGRRTLMLLTPTLKMAPTLSPAALRNGQQLIRQRIATAQMPALPLGVGVGGAPPAAAGARTPADGKKGTAAAGKATGGGGGKKADGGKGRKRKNSEDSVAKRQKKQAKDAAAGRVGGKQTKVAVGSSVNGLGSNGSEARGDAAAAGVAAQRLGVGAPAPRPPVAPSRPSPVVGKTPPGSVAAVGAPPSAAVNGPNEDLLANVRRGC